MSGIMICVTGVVVIVAASLAGRKRIIFASKKKGETKK